MLTDSDIIALHHEVAVLMQELKDATTAFELQSDRLQKIADYVGADDYVDSIGPILTAIDTSIKEASDEACQGLIISLAEQGSLR